MSPIDTLAICIGVNAGLAFAERDAVGMTRVLTSAIAAPGSRAVPLVGAAATRRSLMRTLRALRSCPPQHLIFAFSGHAGPSGILVSDGILRHDELRGALAHVGSDALLCILDCCHAAAFATGDSTFGSDVVGGPLDVVWLHALAAVTTGARAMFAASVDQTAREDQDKGYGFFTGALLDSMYGAPGDPAWSYLLANEATVFEGARSLMLMRRGTDQGAVGLGLVGDMPLVLSQRTAPVGEGTVDEMIPRFGKLITDIGFTIRGRRHVPTQLALSVGRIGGPVLAKRTAWVVPAVDEVADLRTFEVEPRALKKDRVLVRALQQGRAPQLFWNVRVLDQFGRVLAEDCASHTLALRGGLLLAA